MSETDATILAGKPEASIADVQPAFEAAMAPAQAIPAPAREKSSKKDPLAERKWAADTLACSSDMRDYFRGMEKDMLEAYDHAQLARNQGFDPEPFVDIPLARNMTERVEGLISTVAPQLRGTGMNARIEELEKEYGALGWEVAVRIAEEVAKEKFCAFKDRTEAMEVGIRVGFAYHTLGIVSAPLEGFTNIKIKKRKDGKEYLSVWFSGPIRGAGGTAASVCVLIADWVRAKMGLSPYDPEDKEIKRVVTECLDYHTFVTNLQYFPSEEEMDFMIRHLPVELNGEPTEKRDVGNHKDLPRIETNKIRGGVCLVTAEGLCQKAGKIWGRISKWKDPDLDWSWMGEFLDLQKKIKARKATTASPEAKKEKLLPNFTFINDIVAGRPVLSHPLAKGGFRLRYGRGRNTGFVSVGLNPATMVLLKGYLAVGTQLKIERPGKGSTVSINSNVQGPTVLLKDGTVLRVHTAEEATKIQTKVASILYLGDILISYGDFVTFNHFLVPPGYCEEWWIQELERQAVDCFGSLDIYKIAELSGVTQEFLTWLFKAPVKNIPSFADAYKLSLALGVPMHPEYTYHWKDLSRLSFELLLKELSSATMHYDENNPSRIIIEGLACKRVLEELGIPHRKDAERIIIEGDPALALLASLGVSQPAECKEKLEALANLEEQNPLNLANLLNRIKLRDKSGTFIGARMGRPEKSKMRKLKGSPHGLFPIGEEGGKMRSFQSALQAGKVTSSFALFQCETCKKETIFSICLDCKSKTGVLYNCKLCGPMPEAVCKKHGDNLRYATRSIPIKEYFDKSVKLCQIRSYPDLIKGIRGTFNKDHIPEHLIKSILRAKHDVNVNKDGTTRQDISELPITHFKPKEVGTSITRLKELGYVKDIAGKELVAQDQILEIKPQDVILPKDSFMEDSSDEILFRVANFIDDLLVHLYGLKPFYNLKKKEDLVGHKIVGLAPHISSGIVGRIIGFSPVQGFLCHPLFHSAMRRDCDGDEASAILMMDAFLNFSRQYLPDKRGGRTMDAPLVLTMFINPTEVDDQSHDLDVAWRYPLYLYEAALEMKGPKDIRIEQLKHRLKTPLQYEQQGFTMDTDDLGAGITASQYKVLPTMEEKLRGQMELAQIIRAVDSMDVATLVIEKHFIRDIKGNLRKFSMQMLRCVNCNEKYRRPPMKGICLKCNGKILFTITEGSIVKYLDPSLSLAEKYVVSPYLKQSLELTRDRIYSLFGKDKEKQEGLGRWFG